MKDKIRLLLRLWFVLSILTAVMSFLIFRNGGEEVEFILWASVFGAFVWEDLFIFSLANAIGSAVVVWLKDNRYILLFVDIFWIVRSLGETFYWFLQQFSQPTQYPHNFYAWQWNPVAEQVFGDISDQKYFILFQISWQVMTVFAAVGLVYILKHWKELGEKLNE